MVVLKRCEIVNMGENSGFTTKSHSTCDRSRVNATTRPPHIHLCGVADPPSTHPLAQNVRVFDEGLTLIVIPVFGVFSSVLGL